MTLKDRAEKMIDTLAFNRKWDRSTRIRYYVAELEEAIKEANNAKSPNEFWKAGFQCGQMDAYENAAKIAELYEENGRCSGPIRAHAANLARQCDQYHCGHDSCNAARAAELLTDTKPDGD